MRAKAASEGSEGSPRRLQAKAAHEGQDAHDGSLLSSTLRGIHKMHVYICVCSSGCEYLLQSFHSPIIVPHTDKILIQYGFFVASRQDTRLLLCCSQPALHRVGGELAAIVRQEQPLERGAKPVWFTGIDPEAVRQQHAARCCRQLHDCDL